MGCCSCYWGRFVVPVSQLSCTFLDHIDFGRHPPFTMASADVLLPSSSSSSPTPSSHLKRKRSTSTVSRALSKMAPNISRQLAFDPAKHLKFEPPQKIWTMSEIRMAEKGVSPNAVSEPFPLFTHEAVQQMRAEVLSKPVWENCQYKSNIAQCQLRGFAAE